jgi:hypothetical protein
MCQRGAARKVCCQSKPTFSDEMMKYSCKSNVLSALLFFADRNFAGTEASRRYSSLCAPAHLMPTWEKESGMKIQFGEFVRRAQPV